MASNDRVRQWRTLVNVQPRETLQSTIFHMLYKMQNTVHWIRAADSEAFTGNCMENKITMILKINEILAEASAVLSGELTSKFWGNPANNAAAQKQPNYDEFYAPNPPNAPNRTSHTQNQCFGGNGLVLAKRFSYQSPETETMDVDVSQAAGDNSRAKRRKIMLHAKDVEVEGQGCSKNSRPGSHQTHHTS